MHVLINLAQFQAHGARTAGSHKLREAVESALLGESGQGCRTLNGRAQDDGFGNQFSFIFAELLLGFLQLSGGFLSGFFTGSRGSLVLLCFLLVDALCSQSNTLRGALFGLLLSLFGLCGRGNGSCNNHGGGTSSKRRSYRGALGGFIFRRFSTFSRGILNLSRRFFHCGFFQGAFFNSRGVKDQLCGVLLFSVEVLSLGRFRDGHVTLLLNGYSGEQLGLIRDRILLVSDFSRQQFGCLNDSLNLFFFSLFDGFSNLSGFSRVCILSNYLSSSFLSSNLIGSDLAKGLFFAIEGDAQACRVGCRQIIQTSVLCLGDGGAGTSCLHVVSGKSVLSVSGSNLRFFYLILRILSTHSTQVLLKLGSRILRSILRLLSINRRFLSLRGNLFIITQERRGSRLGCFSNRSSIFFNVLDLSDLLNLNRFLRFLGESTKRRQQATALLLLNLLFSQFLSRGILFNLFVIVQEGTLEILNSTVLFTLLIVLVLVACALRLHEAAQGVLQRSSLGVLLRRAPCDDAPFPSSPEGVWARGREHNANVLIIPLILSRA